MAEAQAQEVDPEATVTLQSGDAHNYQVKAKVAKMSQTIKDTMEDTGVDQPIPLPNVKSSVLSQVIQYCTEHVEGKELDEHGKRKKTDDDIQKFDEDFVKNLDQSSLFELILAANYLNMKDLLDLTCSTVAKMIKGKTPQEIRDTFGIQNDFTPEEEEEVLRENQWAFE